MGVLTVKHNELKADEFIELWETVWGPGPTLEQTELAMNNTLFRVSVYDEDRPVGMARLIGDLGLDYYIKDVVVRPEYQGKGLGRMLINELLSFVNSGGIKGTGVFIELAAEPDKMPFYEKFGFDTDDSQRLKMMYRIK